MAYDQKKSVSLGGSFGELDAGHCTVPPVNILAEVPVANITMDSDQRDFVLPMELSAREEERLMDAGHSTGLRVNTVGDVPGDYKTIECDVTESAVSVNDSTVREERYEETENITSPPVDILGDVPGLVQGTQYVIMCVLGFMQFLFVLLALDNSEPGKVENNSHLKQLIGLMNMW